RPGFTDGGGDREFDRKRHRRGLASHKSHAGSHAGTTGGGHRRAQRRQTPWSEARGNNSSSSSCDTTGFSITSSGGGNGSHAVLSAARAVGSLSRNAGRCVQSHLLAHSCPRRDHGQTVRGSGAQSGGTSGGSAHGHREWEGRTASKNRL